MGVDYMDVGGGVAVATLQEVQDLSGASALLTDEERGRQWSKVIQNAVSAIQFLFISASLPSSLAAWLPSTIPMCGGPADGWDVGVRFKLEDVSICCVCSHLAAQVSEVKRRNQDYRELTNRLNFEDEILPIKSQDIFDSTVVPSPPESASANVFFSDEVSHADQAHESKYVNEFCSSNSSVQHATSPFKRDVVIWIGDLNYRINLPDNAVVTLINNKNFSLLSSFDQLCMWKESDEIFNGFCEPPLNFVPTYKLETWSNQFAVKENGKLKRTPAWCDRILYKGSNLFQLSASMYRRHELLGSDHRPVSATLTLTRSKLAQGSPISSSGIESSSTFEKSTPKGLQAIYLYDAKDCFIFSVQQLFMPSCSQELADDLPKLLVIWKESKVVEWLSFPEVEKFKGLHEVSAKQIFGVLGMVDLTHATYLIMITNYTSTGQLPQGQIFTVSDIEILPVSLGPPIPEHEDEMRNIDDREYSVLREVFNSYQLFFSPDFDVSKSQQRLSRNDSQSLSDDFIWNINILSRLNWWDTPKCFKSGSILVPVVCGFCKIVRTKVKSQSCLFALISRRSRFRSGVRFFSRGVDDNGHVSNFVVTEQILVTDAFVSSYELVRGSIPLYWQEGEAIVTLKPTPTLMQGPHEIAMKKHFAFLNSNYGNIGVLSLIDHHGVEADICKAFGEYMKNEMEKNPNILIYEPFDFHKHCGKSATTESREQITGLLDKFDMFHNNLNLFQREQGQQSQVRMEQNSFFRVNCIDCLDRTNVLQAAIGKKILLEQMQLHGLLAERDVVACRYASQHGYDLPLPKLESSFREIWADMGDAISHQYAGTGVSSAMLLDFHEWLTNVAGAEGRLYSVW
eukprot:764668-Hanusia_phi.AAC.3